MSQDEQTGRKLPNYVTIGQVTKPHGIKGALKIEPLTDDPARFHLLKRVYLTFDEKRRTEYQVNKVRIGPQFVYLSLQDVESRDDALKCKSAYIEIPREECLQLEQDQHYYFELIGCDVILKDGTKVGVLSEIQSLPAHDLYVVLDGHREILVPAIAEYIVNVDTVKGVITIDPVEGLLDLGL